MHGQSFELFRFQIMEKKAKTKAPFLPHSFMQATIADKYK